MLLVAIKYLIIDKCINQIFNQVYQNFAIDNPDNGFIKFIYGKVVIDNDSGEIADFFFIPVTGEYEYQYLSELYKQYYGYYPYTNDYALLKIPFAHLIRAFSVLYGKSYVDGLKSLVDV